MILATLDVIAALLFGGAFVVTLATSLLSPQDYGRPTLVFALAALGIMCIVSLDNALGNVGAYTLQSYEEYVEVLFIPLIGYTMWGLYSHTQASRVRSEREVAERLDERLHQSIIESGEYRLEVLQTLSTAVDARDHYTALHSMHVADYACAIASRMGLDAELRHIEQAGLLHDIGKIAIPDRLLLKPSALTDAEYEIVKAHVEESAHILETVPFLAELVPTVRHHHERWDGEGYPHGLAGEQIPQTARILAAADAFDAMTTDRPYRRALSVEEAKQRLAEGRGTQFDPEAVSALIDLIDEGIVVVPQQVSTVA